MPIAIQATTVTLCLLREGEYVAFRDGASESQPMFQKVILHLCTLSRLSRLKKMEQHIKLGRITVVREQKRICRKRMQSKILWACMKFYNNKRKIKGYQLWWALSGTTLWSCLGGWNPFSRIRLLNTLMFSVQDLELNILFGRDCN